jgi:magnesium-dependent phosphatase 1
MVADSDDSKYLPSMIVFDLDYCLWTPEMHELYGMPSIPVQGNLVPDAANNDNDVSASKKSLPNRTAKMKYKGTHHGDIGVTGMKVPGTSQTVYLFDGARRALREIALDPKFKDVLIAVASSSLEPTYSQACLSHIEILPDLTMRDMIAYDEIGRTGHLTSRKTTHFMALHNASQVPYDEMLFFDDCNWGDHCEDVSNSFGVVSQRTPNGLQLSEFHGGLDKYQKQMKDKE